MKVSNKLATPSTLSSEAIKSLTASINPLVADAFALYVKTKNYHWHLSGSHFRDYHLLFDEQADQIFAMVDILAERVRKLGGTTVRSIEHIGQLQRVHDEQDIFVDPKEMVRRLCEDNRNLVARMRSAHSVCNEHQDVATASILEAFIDEAERRVWFLFETSV